MGSVVLITGISRFLGARLAAELASDDAIERVIGVDRVAPSRAAIAQLGRTEFVRADIRNPLIATVLSRARVDTVVHAPLPGAQRGGGGPAPQREHHVLGTMQLLAACQKSDALRRVVVESTTAVYGAGPTDPAVFTEAMHSGDSPLTGYAKDAVEIEGYVRGFARRRPDIAVSVLRFASILGPTIESPLTRYLAMPVVPTSLGFDPRLQLLHESDAVEVLRLVATGRDAGVMNVAADGVVLLSQAVRRAGRLRLPVPSMAIAAVGTILRNSGLPEVSAEQPAFLNYGRVVDTARLRSRFGYVPAHSTDQALESYLATIPRLPRLATGSVTAAQRIVTVLPAPLWALPGRHVPAGG
ncbi:MAG: UDP-glucose 4-epimerase [Pseudonocardiales bacterium]|nr:UDP-glucose 4-epimerase [Pseudonocardiales bacterium]